MSGLPFLMSTFFIAITMQRSAFFSALGLALAVCLMPLWVHAGEGHNHGEAPAAASPVLLPARFGEIALLVELARSDQEQQKGLMFRRTMPADQGMLFVFEKEQRLGFWMKNTYLPLSIAFLNSEFEIVVTGPKKYKYNA